MTDGDQTEVAAELTELAGASDADTQSAYAWGLADDEEIDVHPRRVTPRAITATAVAASLVAILGAGVIAYINLRDRPTEPASAAAPTTTSAAPVAAAPAPAPPPVTVTTVVVQSTIQVPQQAPPQEPGILPPGVVASLDAKFIAAMRADGWSVSDPGLMAHRAHQVCAALQQGATQSDVVGQMLEASNTPPPYQDREINQAGHFVSTAVRIYPNCP